MVERGAKVVNALFKQRSCLENLLRALVALPPLNHMDFEYKLSNRQDWTESVKTLVVDESAGKVVVEKEIVSGVKVPATNVCQRLPSANKVTAGH